MFIREFMTTKVVTVSRDTMVARASWLVSVHDVQQLPVIDDGKLVGIIGHRMIASALPSAATTMSPPEMADSLSRMTVGKLMIKEVITVTPDTTAETALAMMQKNRIGSLVVVDDMGLLVGIISTKDFINRILTPLLGIAKLGTRIHIYECSTTSQIAMVTALIEKHGLGIVAIHVDDCADWGTKDLIVQLSTDDPSEFIRDLTNRGFTAKVRIRKYWPIPKTGRSGTGGSSARPRVQAKVGC